MKSFLLVCSIALPFGCAHEPEAKTVHETSRGDALSYTMQVDATRLERGTGLGAVASVSRLIEDDLSGYFRERKGDPGNETRREIVADAPAPGVAVRVVIEARPDDFCFVAIDVLRVKPDGSLEPTSLAPYSVHYGISMMRRALSALRGSNRPALTQAKFDSLRVQAVDLASKHSDPWIDEGAFARAPRSLTAVEDNRYYAPPTDSGNTLRGHAGDEDPHR